MRRKLIKYDICGLCSCEGNISHKTADGYNVCFNCMVDPEDYQAIEAMIDDHDYEMSNR